MMIEPSTWFAVTAFDTASLVRSRPYTTHGCRPTSAVTHPTWLAMNGRGTANTNVHNNHRFSNNAPRQRSHDAKSVNAIESSPSPTMM